MEGGLTYKDWTVIARSAAPGHWNWTGGWSQPMAFSAVAVDRIVMMHRKSEHGWELVARLAGPAWQRFQRGAGR